MSDPRSSLRERGLLTADNRLTEAGIARCEEIKAEVRGETMKGRNER